MAANETNKATATIAGTKRRADTRRERGGRDWANLFETATKLDTQNKRLTAPPITGPLSDATTQQAIDQRTIERGVAGVPVTADAPRVYRRRASNPGGQHQRDHDSHQHRRQRDQAERQPLPAAGWVRKRPVATGATGAAARALVEWPDAARATDAARASDSDHTDGFEPLGSLRSAFNRLTHFARWQARSWGQQRGKQTRNKTTTADATRTQLFKRLSTQAFRRKKAKN